MDLGHIITSVIVGLYLWSTKALKASVSLSMRHYLSFHGLKMEMRGLESLVALIMKICTFSVIKTADLGYLKNKCLERR